MPGGPDVRRVDVVIERARRVAILLEHPGDAVEHRRRRALRDVLAVRRDHDEPMRRQASQQEAIRRRHRAGAVAPRDDRKQGTARRQIGRAVQRVSAHRARVVDGYGREWTVLRGVGRGEIAEHRRPHWRGQRARGRRGAGVAAAGCAPGRSTAGARRRDSATSTTGKSAAPDDDAAARAARRSAATDDDAAEAAGSGSRRGTAPTERGRRTAGAEAASGPDDARRSGTAAVRRAASVVRRATRDE